MSIPNDRLGLLATFIRIAERGSISAAARDMGVTQATASRQLASLEAMLGVSLIYRTTHDLSLTDAGQSALFAARNTLGAWDNLEDLITEETGELSGPLRVVAPIALGQMQLAHAALGFQAAHPAVQLDWQLDDGRFNFVERGCDVWIKVGPVDDDRLILKPLAEVERLIVSAPQLAEVIANKPERLGAQACLALSPFEGDQITLTHTSGKTWDVEPRVSMMTNNIFVGLTGVRSGQGFAILPRWLVSQDLTSGALVDALPGWRAETLIIHVAYLPARRSSKRLIAFLNHIEEAFDGMDGVRLV